MLRKHLRLCVLVAAMMPSGAAAQAQDASPRLSGERMVWRPITLDLDGPTSSETAKPNPFADYRLDVTFSQGERRFTVPGYFAACGTAAETGCAKGAVWRVKFTPDKAGTWRYSIRFRQGKDVAATLSPVGGKPVARWDGASGQVEISPAGTPSDDPRNRGRLIYDGSRYLKYAATGEPFFKVGADAPENMLAFDGFDATPNAKGLRKSWAPHVRDAAGIDLKTYGWQGRGAGILGAVAYLADQGANAVSFLTFNIVGDDQNVFPHLIKGGVKNYEAHGEGERWTEGVHHDRFDVSKLDQWQRVLGYANDRGMFLHFKLQETENDDLMDGGRTERRRILYLREMVARFGHSLALNWNIGEENDQPATDHKAMLAALKALDPYGHLRVMHTFPEDKDSGFTPLLGDLSELTGISLQGSGQDMSDVRPDVLKWVALSVKAGKPWVISYDEPGSADAGAPVDAAYPDARLPSRREVQDDRTLMRGKVLWAILTGGGTGVEYYYGYETGCSDLDCQDHRTRETKWRDGRIALTFFRTHVGRHAQGMRGMDSLIDRRDAYVFAKPGDRYVVYVPDGAETTLRVPKGGVGYRISWYDPRDGGALQAVKVVTASGDGKLVLGTAPSAQDQDWVALVVHASP